MEAANILNIDISDKDYANLAALSFQSGIDPATIAKYAIRKFLCEKIRVSPGDVYE